MSIRFASLAWLLLLLTTSLAAEPLEMELWPTGVPDLPAGEVGEIVVEENASIGHKVVKVTKPKLVVYKPAAAKDTGAAVVVCPGGGYNILAIDHEGVDVCKWLNEIGVTGILLYYRVPRHKTLEKHIAPLQDAQRALRLSRANAAAWKIDPQRIGVLGFSAGGHLAAATGTNYNTKVYDRVDDADDLSCKPDFLVLIYPAYLTTDYRGTSMELSPEIVVDKNTPPAFLAHAYDDPVSPTNSLAFFLALKKAGVPAEMHIYPSGGHGYGIWPKEDHAVTVWPRLAARWFKSAGIVK